MNYYLVLLLGLIVVVYMNWGCIHGTNVNESFFNTNKLDTILRSINTNNLRYDKFNQIDLDEFSIKILTIAKKNPSIERTIKQKMIEIYKHILDNKELRSYLRFNNLINQNNLPIFINESDELLLLNEIKIILITMPKNDFDLLKLYNLDIY